MKFSEWYVNNQNTLRGIECLINVVHDDIECPKSIISKLKITFNNAISLFGNLLICRFEASLLQNEAFMEITLQMDNN